MRLALLLLYAVGLTAFGVWVGRRVRGSSDFFVAGRRLSAPLLFSTVLAANIGAGTTVGATGQAYIDGVGAWWWNGAAGLGSLVLAFWVGPRLWRQASSNGFLTAGDYLEHRYGALVRGLLASLIWLGTLAILAGQLIAGAAVLTAVAGIPRPIGAAIGGVAMTVYFTAGGLLSSAWVNAVQLVVLLVGLVVAVPLAISAAGGWTAIAATPGLPDTFWNPLHSTGPGSGYAFLALLGPAFVISPGLVQKAYGARRRAGGAPRHRRRRRGAAALRVRAAVPRPRGAARCTPTWLPATWSCRRCWSSRCRGSSAPWRSPRCSAPRSAPATRSCSCSRPRCRRISTSASSTGRRAMPRCCGWPAPPRSSADSPACCWRCGCPTSSPRSRSSTRCWA